MTDYVAIINRFATEGVIGEMDCVYSSWATRHPDGFSDAHIAGLVRLAPFFALAIKSVALARIRRADMVRAFIESPEYRQRFGGAPSGDQRASQPAVAVKRD